MNYALKHQLKHYTYLYSTPRKKVLKHSLITIHQGLAFIKLGKNEYAVEKGESFWIPFDCLTSVTYMPETRVSVMEFSIRLKDNFPTQSGYVELPKITHAIIEKLATSNVSTLQEKALLEVIRFEMTEIIPKLWLTKLSERISTWKPDQALALQKEHDLPKELQLALNIREAKKRILSGNKREKVIDSLFNGSATDFEQASQIVLGTSL